MEKIGLGGGCHWCTEAVFASLRGVTKVEQGWIAAEENKVFSEAVIVHYDESAIDLRVLLAVHLYTHSSTANHSMRNKYRSAVYTFAHAQKEHCVLLLQDLQATFEDKLVTTVLQFHAFRSSPENELDYFYQNPDKPFCTSYIHPKLKILLQHFAAHVNTAKINSSLAGQQLEKTDLNITPFA
ncbi:MAG: peptide-methionine (S)-S-oxide reductase [Chitinophagaceae bacterium]